MNFKKEINQFKIKIDNDITTVYENGPKNINEPINYILSGGKRIRPILTYLSYASVNKNMDISPNLINVCLSIELLHNFTLIHDDIMDSDDLRHGKKTIHKKWNDSIAILSGDAMLSIALVNLDKIDVDNKQNIVSKFHDALVKVCEGQALDIMYQDKNNISVEEYINMVDKKTGYMIGLSAELGALLANCDIDISDNLKRYGQLLGRGFQIQDDLLEIVSNSQKMGKSLDSDFILNKKTYLYLKAIEKNENKVNEIRSIASEDNKLGFKLLKDFMYQENIISDAELYVKNLLNEANEILAQININPNKLLDYSKMILERRN